jgi:CDP-diglyceride synthetase
MVESVEMINTKNFKNLLKPFLLARIIIGIIVIAIGVYYFMYSNIENTYSLSYLLTIQQILLATMFLLNGIEELKKPNSKKASAYWYFGTAFIMTVLNIAKHLRYL